MNKDADIDEYIFEVWEKTLHDFKTVTGKDPRNTESSVADLKAELDSFTGKSQTREILKASASKVLDLADIATSAVSPVFPQAGTVFTALKIVSSMVDNYHRFFGREHLLEKFKAVGDHLDRIGLYFQHLSDGVDIGGFLKGWVARSCNIILKLCTIFCTIGQNSETIAGKIKNMLKAAVNYDQGVEALLKELQDEADRELRHNTAATRAADISAENLQKRAAMMQDIKKSLRIDDSVLTWRDTQEDLVNHSVDNMGSWLQGHLEFSAWTSVGQSLDHPVLVLDAEENHGKSYLCCCAIRLLQKKFETKQQNPPVSVAWFYSEKLKQMQSTKKTRQQTRTLLEAMQSLVWQLAESDRSYMDFVAQRLESDSEISLSDAVEIWDRLIAGFATQYSGKESSRTKVFFLIVDGIDQLTSEESDASESILSRMCETASKSRQGKLQIRLLVTCNTVLGSRSRSRSIRHDSQRMLGISPEARKQDAKLFISHQLEPWRKKWEKEYNADFDLSSWEQNLARKFTGDYLSLFALLQAAVQSESIGEFENIIRKASNDGFAVTQWKLQRLNRDLNDMQKYILNDLLVCQICLDIWPSLPQLVAYLQVHNMDTEQDELQELIQTKYSHVLRVRRDDEVYSHDDVYKYFSLRDQESKGQHLYNQYQNGRDSGNVLSQAEPDQLKHLLQSILREEVLAQFDLDHMVNAISIGIRPVPEVGFCLADGHIRIVLALLRAVNEGKRCLFGYAATSLPMHLEKIPNENIERLPEAIQREIGKLLYVFFCNENTVKQWLPLGSPDEFYDRRWLQNIPEVRRWLGLAQVRCGALDESSERKDDQFDKSFPHPGGESEDEKKEEQIGRLLLHCTKELAFQWLHSYSWDAPHAFQLLVRVASRAKQVTLASPLHYVFAEKLTSKKGSADNFWESVDKASASESVTKEMILHSEIWAEKQYNFTLPNMKIPNFRVAETLIGVPGAGKTHRQEADSICSGPRRQGPLNKDAALSCAKVQQSLENWEGALDTLKSMKDSILSPESKRNNTSTWRYWLDQYWKLCDRTQDGNEALKLCVFLQDRFGNDQETVSEALEKASEWMERLDDQSTQHLNNLSATPSNGKHSFLTTLLERKACDPKFHHNFYVSLNAKYRMLLKAYFDAVVIAGSQDINILSHLRYYYGLCMYHQSLSEGQSGYGMSVRDAIQVWEESIEAMRKSSNDTSKRQQLEGIFSRTTHRLATAYIEMSRRSELGNSDPVFPALERTRQLGHKNSAFFNGGLHDFTLLQGRIYHLFKQDYEAKMSLNPYLTTAIGFLFDKRHENDWTGYEMIARACSRLGDKKNALTAWSLIICDPVRDRSRGGYRSCHGGCEWEWQMLDDLEEGFSVCLDCSDVLLDESCKKKLVEGKLKQRICGKDHQFLDVPKRDSRIVQLIRDECAIEVGEKTVKIDRWKKEICWRYGVSTQDAKQAWPRQQLDFLRITRWKLRDRYGPAKLRSSMT